MSLNRTKSWLFAWGLQVLSWKRLCARRLARSAGIRPRRRGRCQRLSQPDLTAYDGAFGNALQAPSGYFGNVDILFWTVSAPRRTQVGLEDGSRQVYVNNMRPLTNAAGTVYTVNNNGVQFVTETNSVDTGFINAAFHSGARADFGYVGDEDLGYLFSAFYLNSTSQSLQASNAAMVFSEPLVTVYNAFAGVGTNGVELPATYTQIPILDGFVDQTGGGATGNQPDGIADDLNRNNLYGPSGRDRGVVTGNVLTPGTTLSGVPSREGQVDTITNLGTAGPFPGTPAPLLNTTTPGPKQPIDYGDAVPLPLIFNNLTVVERSSAMSAEANRLWRLGTGRFGGTWDVLVVPDTSISRMTSTSSVSAASWPIATGTRRPRTASSHRRLASAGGVSGNVGSIRPNSGWLPVSTFKRSGRTARLAAS